MRYHCVLRQYRTCRRRCVGRYLSEDVFFVFDPFHYAARTQLLVPRRTVSVPGIAERTVALYAASVLYLMQYFSTAPYGTSVACIV
eukprot:1789252-Rhodomonas_salina.9